MTARNGERSSRRRGRDGARGREPRLDRALFWVLAADIVLLALTGGPPPGPITTALCTVAAVALLGLLALAGAGRDRPPPAAVQAVLVAIVALPALQLVPLPPAWWHTLPGAARRAASLALVGAERGWQPVSIVPIDTAAAVLLAFCFAVLLAALVALRDQRFDQLLVVLGLVTLAHLAVGIVQAASGGSPRFHAAADHGNLLGFFANKNHAGVMIAAGLALATCLVELFAATRARRRLWLGAATGLALVCAVATNSRAGVLLTAGVGSWIAVRFLATGRPAMRVAVTAGGAALLALFSLSPVFDKLFSRFGGVGQDLRWRFTEQSLPLAREYAITGAGGGSFSRLFIVHERLAWVKPTIVNQVHDEYIQTLIEYGVLGLVVLAVAILVLARTGWTAWRRTVPGDPARGRMEAGAVIVLLFLVHSAIDYPLRRPASWALFAAGCALVIRGAVPGTRGDPRGSRRNDARGDDRGRTGPPA